MKSSWKHFSQSRTKSTKWPMRPAKTLITLGIHPIWSESLVCAQWVAMYPRLLHADSEDTFYWADAQADLSLCWVQGSFRLSCSSCNTSKSPQSMGISWYDVSWGIANHTKWCIVSKNMDQPVLSCCLIGDFAGSSMLLYKCSFVGFAVSRLISVLLDVSPSKNWATSWQNQQNDQGAQRRLGSAWAFVFAVRFMGS